MTCLWRKLWPKFGRLLNYKHVDDTNIVERHWQFIKYTALRGRINQSIANLVHVFIGDNEIGTCIGGTVDLHPVQIVGIKQLDLKRPKGY